MQSINRREFLKILGAGLAGGMYLNQQTGFPTQREPIFPQENELSGKPNIILIVLDTVRARSMSLYGYERETTPNLTRLAAKGLVFNRAIAPSSWTLPSHSSFFTGQYPSRLKVDWHIPLNTTYPTLAEAFSVVGYLTAGFVANFWYCGYETGLARGFNHYEDFPLTLSHILLASAMNRKISSTLKLQERLRNKDSFERKNAETLRKDFISWLKKNQEKRPFFAFLNFFDAHAPYLPPDYFAQKYSSKKPKFFELGEYARKMDPQTIKYIQDAYDGTIAYLDFQISNLYDNLGSLGLLENTIIIITSDHGEQFGEHDLLGHGNSLYNSLLHVPLLILFPGSQIETGIIDHPVNLIDLPATLVDIAGIKGKIVFPGKSLMRYTSSNASPEVIRSEVLISKDMLGIPAVRGWWKSLIHEGFHYVKRPEGLEELYKLGKNFVDVINLSNNPMYREQLEFFRCEL